MSRPIIAVRRMVSGPANNNRQSGEKMNRKHFGHAIAVTAMIALSALAYAQQEEEFEPVDLPDNIAEKVAGFDQEKIDFLRCDGIFRFAGSHELLFDRFKNKSPEDVEAYIDAMMRVKELMKFDPETDMESIPLNTDSPGFNSWKTRRPAEFDTPRDAGPININRYLSASPKQGIPTFFNLPVALTPEDLVAGEVDVAIMGIGLDTGCLLYTSDACAA